MQSQFKKEKLVFSTNDAGIVEHPHGEEKKIKKKKKETLTYTTHQLKKLAQNGS